MYFLCSLTDNLTWVYLLLETTYHICMMSQHSWSMTCIHVSIQWSVVMWRWCHLHTMLCISYLFSVLCVAIFSAKLFPLSRSLHPIFPISVLFTHLLPPLYPDASLTPQNIFQATSDVDYHYLNDCFGVPHSVYYQITANPSYPTEEKRREAMIVYYLNTIPLASWATLAGGLYYRKEHVSLEAVRKYLHHTTG